MTTTIHIQDLEFQDTDIVIEYRFIESELDYFLVLVKGMMLKFMQYMLTMLTLLN